MGTATPTATLIPTTFAGTMRTFALSPEFSTGLAITAGPDGNVWYSHIILDPASHSVTAKIGRITPAGAFTEWALPTRGVRVSGIIRGPDGNLWFTEGAAPPPGSQLYASKIGRITPSGSFREWTLPAADGVAYGITAGPDGNLWFTMSRYPTRSYIGRITPSGAITMFPVPSLGLAGAITEGPDGNLWFTELTANTGNGNIGRITPNGTFKEFPLPGSDTSAYTSAGGITAGPDGNLWFTEGAYDPSTSSSTFGIGRISPTGAVTEFPLPSKLQGDISGIVAGPDGNLWFPVYLSPPNVFYTTGYEVGRITPKGIATNYTVAISNTTRYGLGEFGITVGPDDALWFVAGRNLVRLT